MPLELQIIRAREFVRINASGDLNLEASKAVLGQLARACRKRNIERAMLDLRNLKPGPTPRFAPTDLAEIVGVFHDVGFTHKQRLAVFYNSDPHHGARMFAFIGKQRGWNVSAFNDFERAILWLSEDQPKAAHRAERPVEVRFRSPTGDGHPRAPAHPHKRL